MIVNPFGSEIDSFEKFESGRTPLNLKVIGERAVDLRKATEGLTFEDVLGGRLSEDAEARLAKQEHEGSVRADLRKALRTASETAGEAMTWESINAFCEYLASS